MTNALVVTTQRYLSFAHGEDDADKVYKVFGNSLILHFAIALGVLLILLIVDYPIVYKILHIPTDRLFAASVVFLVASLMLFMAIITAPLRALFFARENIVYISVVDVLDGALKLLFAVWLAHVSGDRLIVYAFMLLGIQILNFLLLSVYAGIKYEECHLPRLREFDKQWVKDLSYFAGWSVYASGCVVVRNQSIAVLLNLFLSTVANAAYGIAQQVSGAVTFVSASIINAVNPQLMKAEGAGNRERMVHLAEQESKFSFIVLALFSVPIMFEMPSILSVWLTEVPPFTVNMCRLLILAVLCDQLTIGLTSANQAVGQIKTYTLCFYSIKILTVLGVWLCLFLEYSVNYAFLVYVLIEFADSFVRLPLLKKQIGLDILRFCKNAILPAVIPLIVIILTSYFCVVFVQIKYRFLLTIVLSVLIGGVAIYIFGLNKREKQYIGNLVLTIRSRVSS